MIRQRPPTDSRESATTGEYFDAINDGGKGAKLKIGETRAFAREVIKAGRQHGMSSHKPEVVVAKCVGTNDDDVHACCARPCSHRIRLNLSVSCNRQLLSRNLSRGKGGWLR